MISWKKSQEILIRIILMQLQIRQLVTFLWGYLKERYEQTLNITTNEITFVRKLGHYSHKH